MRLPAAMRPGWGPRSSGDLAISYSASIVEPALDATLGATRATSGSPKCGSSASNQLSGRSTSVSTKATSGVVTSARPALRAAAGPRLVDSRIRRCPGTAASAGSLPSSTTMISPPSCTTFGWALYAGTTIVTSAAVNGDSVCTGWMAPAATRRSVNMAWLAGNGRSSSIASTTRLPAADSRNSRSGEPAITTRSCRRYEPSSTNETVTLATRRRRRRDRWSAW